MFIHSLDIDQSKFTLENLQILKNQFPSLDDESIARYLIARDNNLELTSELLMKAENWRKIHLPILKQDCMNELKKGIMYPYGFDKEGRPLLIIRLARHDPKQRNLIDAAKAVLWMTDQIIRRLPADKSKFTILLNRHEVGANNTDLEFSRNFSKLFQDQHPERLHKVVVYPSGVLFWTVWNIAKWFFDPVTRAKVSPCLFFSGVQEFIDDEYIPQELGGKSIYEFNLDDYPELLPEEEVQRILNERSQDIATTPELFFNPERDAASGNYDS